MLYRIDLSYPDGRVVPLSDLRGPRLIPRWSDACAAAIEAASEILAEAGGMPTATITRIGKFGRLSTAGIVLPESGFVRRPDSDGRASGREAIHAPA